MYSSPPRALSSPSQALNSPPRAVGSPPRAVGSPPRAVGFPPPPSRRQPAPFNGCENSPTPEYGVVEAAEGMDEFGSEEHKRT